MQPTKRQIIKTRPQRPYIVARIVLIVTALVALSLAAWLWLRPHPAHAFALSQIEMKQRSFRPVSITRQEATIAKRMATIQPTWERGRS